MQAQPLSTSQFTEVDYICVAGDLLTKMMSELQSLQINNRRLTLAMATAGHDLRQRLQTLMGTIELLTSCQDVLRSKELTRRARSLVYRLAQELEHLAFQAEQDRAPAPGSYCFVISTLLARIRNDWQSIAEQKQLAFNVVETDCLVESDQRLLAVILDNVVGNAVRHTAHGGVLVSSMVDRELLILSVTDTGPGITAEDLQRSYSFRARGGDFSQGLGLGLSIARKTAELLGHQFEVTTGAHRGTCIRLYVPLAAHSVYTAPLSQ